MRFGPGKVLEKSLVLIHQNLWEPCETLYEDEDAAADDDDNDDDDGDGDGDDGL